MLEDIYVQCQGSFLDIHLACSSGNPLGIKTLRHFSPSYSISSHESLILYLFGLLFSRTSSRTPNWPLHASYPEKQDLVWLALLFIIVSNVHLFTKALWLLALCISLSFCNYLITSFKKNLEENVEVNKINQKKKLRGLLKFPRNSMK